MKLQRVVLNTLVWSLFIQPLLPPTKVTYGGGSEEPSAEPAVASSRLARASTRA